MKTIQVALAAALVTTIGVCACACSCVQDDNLPKKSSTQIAATVNDVAIPEEKVQTYISTIRMSSDTLESEEGWQAWLESSNMTEEELREQVMDYFIKDELIRQASVASGITLDESDIDSEVEAVKKNYADDEAWQNALASAGLTEEEYRSSVELSALTAKLKEEEVVQPEPTQDELQQYYNAFAQLYSGKRSSFIQFSSDDEKTARSVADELMNSRHLFKDFADAAAKYSTDSSTADKGGDANWECNTILPTEYKKALSTLEVGQMYPEPVQTDYGYYIILCTDEYIPEPEGNVNIDAVPEEIDAILRKKLDEELLKKAFDIYITNLRVAAKIVMYDSAGNPIIPTSS